MPAGSIERPVIALDNVSVLFTKKKLLRPVSVVRAVDGATLHVGRGEVVGLVGESGSGKTTLGRAAIGLQRVTSGKVVFSQGETSTDVESAKGRDWRQLRQHLQIIFQDPFSSMDPNMRVFDVLKIPLQAHGVKGKERIESAVEDVFRRVGLPNDILSSFVFQLSGGQRQRVSIARVLLLNPDFIVADEAVSMLDVSLKGDILKIMRSIADELGVGILFITHEMAVAKVISDRIAVMYLGNLVELGPSEAIASKPLHPYTQALLQASPAIDPSLREVTRSVNVKGEIPHASAYPSGCRFHPRCPFAMPKCSDQVPELREVEDGHYVSCWLY